MLSLITRGLDPGAIFRGHEHGFHNVHDEIRPTSGSGKTAVAPRTDVQTSELP
jgi:hypothetical protein